MACAVEASSLHHREANASVLKYTFDLLHVGRSKEEREDFAERQALAGKATDVKNLCNCKIVGFYLSSSHQSLFIDKLSAI